MNSRKMKLNADWDDEINYKGISKLKFKCSMLSVVAEERKKKPGKFSDFMNSIIWW